MSVQAARSQLAEAWARAHPETPEEIAAFYIDTSGLAEDLERWHATPERQQVTTIIQYVAKEIGAGVIGDIGCGLGTDMVALQHAGIGQVYWGVEPNIECREVIASGVDQGRTSLYLDVRDAPVADADLLLCIDVLEHIPDPENWLASWAQRVRLGAVLIEHTATQDITHPLHLVENRGWHPGRCLERLGWVKLDQQGAVRVWQRAASTAGVRSSLLLAAYRAITIPTLASILALAGVDVGVTSDTPVQRLQRISTNPWRIFTRHADGLISRARSIIASRWWAETADDVFLMVDDDIAFDPIDAERLVAQCRGEYPIICAAYPVGDGGHLATRQFAGQAIEFPPAGLSAPPVEIEYAATGFLAVHRKVLDALIPTLPLCHADQPWAFWPLFLPDLAPMGNTTAYLSEDWAFIQRARQAGFKCWLDPNIRVRHLKEIPVDVGNMQQIHRAITGG